MLQKACIGFTVAIHVVGVYGLCAPSLSSHWNDEATPTVSLHGEANPWTLTTCL